MSDDPDIRAAERAHDRHDKFAGRMGENAVQTGLSFLRSMILINGGAAVTIIAFLGTLVGQQKIASDQLHAVAYSLLWFAFGIAASAVSLGFGYLANFSAGGYLYAHKYSYIHPYVEANDAAAPWGRRSKRFVGVSIFAAICSVVLFMVGVFVVYNAVKMVRI